MLLNDFRSRCAVRSTRIIFNGALRTAFCVLVLAASAQAANDKTRANSYDDAWQSAWINHGRSLLGSATGKTNGFVLEVGDSITHSRSYSLWPAQGLGQTAEDSLITTWTRSSTTTWPTSMNAPTSKSGWYLAGADTTGNRGMTASSGISLTEFVSGSGNGSTAMPSVTTTASAAQQTISNSTYDADIHINTLVTAFGDAQVAVVMLGTNDPNSSGLTNLTTIVDRLEAAKILPILSTIPPVVHYQGITELNASIRQLAQTRNLPLIDYYQEILLRRPGTTWQNTLISADGVHPTGNNGGYNSDSDPYTPGGDPTTHTTGDATLNSGYLLRSWLTVQKLKEVKINVIDALSGSSACDVNQDGATNVTDVQRVVNQAIGVTSCTADINQDGSCNVIDVQRVVNSALGGPCVSP